VYLTIRIIAGLGVFGVSPRHYGPYLIWTVPWLLWLISVSIEVQSLSEILLIQLRRLGILIYYTASSSLLFYFGFELAGFPLLLAIITGGRQPQKLEAFKTMLFYIAILALPLLLILLTREYRALSLISLSTAWIIFPFLAKTPAYVLHAWLPKAHVEASTVGSMILAGSVIKLGAYGVVLASGSLYHIQTLRSVLMASGVCLVGLCLIRNPDAKRLVAYSRVLHIAVGIISWSSGSMRGIYAMIGANISHTLLSPLIFYSVSFFYHTLTSRDRLVFRGWLRRSLISLLILFVFLVNAGIPPWLLSASEIWMVYGVRHSIYSTFIVAVGIFFSGLWTLLISGDQRRQYRSFSTVRYITPIITRVSLCTVFPFLLI